LICGYFPSAAVEINVVIAFLMFTQVGVVVDVKVVCTIAYYSVGIVSSSYAVDARVYMLLKFTVCTVAPAFVVGL
jgi:hypothetical protein